MFMHLMHNVFWDLLVTFVVICLDDILVYLSLAEEHWSHVRMVLQHMHENYLFVKCKKCQFAQTTTDVLGHLILPESIAVDPEKSEALQSWQPPH